MAARLLWTLDLDDTLIDTEGSIRPRVRESIRRALGVLGTPPDPGRDEAIVDAIAGVGTSAASRLPLILAALGLEPSSPAAAAAREGYYQYYERDGGLPTMPGAREAIALLRERGPVVIITNGPAELQARKVEAARLAAHVDGVIISGVEGVEKPDPAIFLLACQRADIPPERATHIGDSLTTDMAGARAAGFRTVWFRREWAAEVTPDPAPDAVIEGLDDLARLPALAPR